ncbi:MAG: hypothetical protein J6A88_00695 [Oscillospiraceae bacterium]|nr:hypothetical protein [Oscillospiraceae bacterium]
MKTIVFIGDSITDSWRHRDNDRYRGAGWVTMTSGRIGADYPGQYQFFNRGIGGNRTSDLLARVKKDCINLQPDILTIMIGVNDVWHEVNENNGVSPELGEKIMDLFIVEVKNALPDIKIVIIEPFVFCGKATQENWETFSTGVALRAEMSRRLAEKWNLPFIIVKEELQKLIDKTDVAYVCYDGVHPTCNGHEIISRVVYEELKKIL